MNAMKKEFILLECVAKQPLCQSHMKSDVEKVVSHFETVPEQEEKWDIVDLVGKNGPWQRRIFLVALFISIPTATHNLSMTFLAPELEHWCARTPEAQNLTVEQWRSIGLPQQDQRCSRFKNINFSNSNIAYSNDTNGKQVVPCTAWEYDDSFYKSTVLSQWDLVCDREWMVSMSKSVFVIGILSAVTVFGYFADRLGRRLVMAISAFIGVSSAVICMFSTSLPMFIISRFFTAFGICGCYNTSFVLLMEVLGHGLRSVYGLAVSFGWCLGFVSLPGIAYILRDWFWIQVALTLPCLLMLVIWWVVPESPRWLLSQGRVEEAQEILLHAAEVNGVDISTIESKLKKVLVKAVEAHESGESGGNLFDLLRTPGLWQMALNVYFIWFVTAFVYYGLSYNTNELAGDPFFNFSVSGAVEFPAYFFSIFAIRMLGRRQPLAGTMIIGGLACLLSYPLPNDPGWLRVTVAMIGKFCITASFGIVYVFTAELFPTVVRNIGVGSASFCARVGSSLAPFIRELGHATHPVLPQIVFGVLAAVSGALVLLLPETNNCHVADTLQEAAEASKRRSKN